LFWYIKDAMPHPQTGSLTDDETYSLVAYILNINEMQVDGQDVDEDFVLNAETYKKIVMPNVNGFEPSIDGPQGPENVRKYFANPANFGGKKVNPDGTRCMTDCQEKTVEVATIKNGGINDFHPPLNNAKDLPAQEGKSNVFDAKKAYAENCAMCHDTGVGPAPGEKSEWRKRTADGMEKVYANGINGINGMPPKGGTSLSDSEFKLVVDYLVK
jgi:cytochrome c